MPAGRLFGIRLWLHWSWFLVLGLVIWIATADLATLYPDLGPVERLLMGSITGTAFFGCLAIHESAHAVVARRFGVHVDGITLFLFGGVAEIRGELPTPAMEFAVALAGPATSLVLAGLCGLGSIWVGGLGWTGAEGVLLTLAMVNTGVAVFNLVPGLPLDGGRLLRSVLWRTFGRFDRATKVASGAGKLLGGSLFAAGTILALTGSPRGVWYLPMGVFLWLLARASGRASAPGGVARLALEDREGN